MRAAIRNHPAISFFALAFILGGLPLALVTTEILPVGFSQLGALSASAAGIVLAGVEGGKKSIKELMQRGLIWRVGFRWWITAFLYIAPLAAAALFISMQLQGTSFDWSSLRPLYEILPLMLVLIVLAGLGEEFGWRGFLLPRLQCRHSALIASLIVGIFHSLWHIPLFLVEGTAQNAWALEIGFALAFLGYSIFVIAWSIQLAWFFNNTQGSVLCVAVVHGAGNAWIGGYFDITGNAGIAGNNVLTALMVSFSLLVLVIAGHRHLSRNSEKNILTIDK